MMKIIVLVFKVYAQIEEVNQSPILVFELIVFLETQRKTTVSSQAVLSGRLYSCHSRDACASLFICNGAFHFCPERANKDLI